MSDNLEVPMSTETRLINNQPPIYNQQQHQHSDQHPKHQQEVVTQPQIKSNKQSNKSQADSQIVNFFKLYRFASKFDYGLIIIGIVFSIATGLGLPFFAVVAGKMVDAFDLQANQMVEQTNQAKNLFLFIGMGTFFASWIAFSAWTILGQRISLECRKKYLQNLMKQDLSYFKEVKQQVLSEQFSANVLKFRDALGLKVGTFIFIAASLVAGGRNAISTGWQLSIVIVSTLPILGLSGVLYSFLVQLKKSKFIENYTKADQKAKQATQFIKTVKSLNGQQHELNLYSKCLQLIKQKVLLFSIFAGFGSGWFAFVQFGVYALAFWYGSHCVQGSERCPNSGDDKYTPGQVIIIFFAFYVRLDSMQQLLPSLRKIYSGMQAAFWLYQLIDKQPKVISHSNQIIKTHSFKGLIQFREVTFLHPQDKSKKILNKISFKVSDALTVFHGRNQQKTAILDLIMRFYEPDEGQIFIDQVNLKFINLQWLRKQFGYLNQEPSLFEGSIKQNIICETSTQITDEQIWKILQKLQIYDSIQLYQDKLQSNIGYLGKKISKIQRKKIQIARLIVKNPKMLIIKQLLSQLSQQKQFNLYQNLQKWVQQQGKVIIYTGTNQKIIKNSNKIIVTEKGEVQAEGTYHNLPKYFEDRIVLETDTQSLTQCQFNLNKKVNVDIKKQLLQQTKLHSNSTYVQMLQQPIYCLSPQRIAINYEEANKKRFNDKAIDMLFYYTKDMKIVYYAGMFISLLCGLLYPIFSIFLADTLLDIFKFKNYPTEESFIRQQITNPIYAMLYIGAFAFIFNFLEICIISVIAQKIGEKMRIQTYQKVLNLPVELFTSSPLNSSFKTAQHLKNDPPNSIGLPTQFYAIIVKNSTSAIIGILIAFIFEWRSALLGIFVLPLMMFSGFLSSVFYFSLGDQSQKVYIQSTSIITETIINIKSIQLYKTEGIMLNHYDLKLVQPWNYSKKRANLVGLTLATSQFIIFASFTIMFYLGSLFLKDNPNSISRLQLFSAIFAIIWPGWTSGSNFFVMPNVKMGKKAASNIFKILQQQDEKQMQLKQKSKLLTSGIKGNIYFKNVKIKYPQKGLTFQKVTFKIKANQLIALFGLPGYGNGPFIDALFRFTQIQQGNIYIDDQNIKDYELNYLRSCLGIISQNPVYFKGTIRQNIAYNMLDVTQEDFLKVCKLSNIIQIVNGQEKIQKTNRQSRQLQLQNHDEADQIEQNGFDTFLDNKKSQISTNQKQRISIARTMLRNPQILLINDEIPSVSYLFEQKLKSAIKKILYNRTSIFMPHYDQTLHNVDNIIFLQKDKVLQLGKYQNLQKNFYIRERLKRDYYFY